MTRTRRWALFAACLLLYGVLVGFLSYLLGDGRRADTIVLVAIIGGFLASSWFVLRSNRRQVHEVHH